MNPKPYNLGSTTLQGLDCCCPDREITKIRYHNALIDPIIDGTSALCLEV